MIAKEGDKGMKREGTGAGGWGLKQMGVGCMGVKGARNARFAQGARISDYTALPTSSVM